MANWRLPASLVGLEALAIETVAKMSLLGGVGGAFLTAIQWVMPPGRLSYYLSWIVVANLAFFTFLLWGDNPPPKEGEPDIEAMLRDPWGIAFFVVCASLAGVFFARLIAATDKDTSRENKSGS